MIPSRRYEPYLHLVCLADHFELHERSSSLRRLTSQIDSIGNWETDESFDQDERDLATACGTNLKYFKLDLRTDDYGFETSWILAKKQSNTLVKIASGPPSGTTYRDDNVYVGGEL